MAEVAKYQNDGTDRIAPSKFVERAESANGKWQAENALAVVDFLTGGGDIALLKLGLRISEDISATCDRIKTGRLKRSFTPKIETR